MVSLSILQIRKDNLNSLCKIVQVAKTNTELLIDILTSKYIFLVMISIRFLHIILKFWKIKEI
jgi:hypothetical protein